MPVESRNVQNVPETSEPCQRVLSVHNYDIDVNLSRSKITDGNGEMKCDANENNMMGLSDISK